MSDICLPIPISSAVEGTGAVIPEWMKKKLEVVDTRDEESESLLWQRIGYDYGPTIFKREKKANSHRELPKPRAVVIGPYHFRENSLTFNDDYKWKITRFIANGLRVDVEKYLAEIVDEEENARTYYSEDLSEWSSEEFRTMLLLDSSFILFAMDASRKKQPQYQDEIWEYNATFYTDVRKHMKQIKLDMLMPDNQIPFFAIKKLFECFPKGNIIFDEDSIELLALRYFDNIWPMRNEEQEMKRNEEQEMNDETDFDHLLHLFHWSRIPVEGYEIDSEDRKRGSKNASEQYIPSATELKKSAIKFEKKNSGSNLEITFARGLTKISAVINIPTLYLYDYTEEIFHNLIAFELNPTNNVRCFTAYSACMSCLLQREDDVKLLRESEIIASTAYNDADVVKFFKDLNLDVEGHLVPDDLLHLYGRVMIHHNSQISRWYGNFPWVSIAVAFGYLFSLVTLVECVYTILSYQVPRNNK